MGTLLYVQIALESQALQPSARRAQGFSIKFMRTLVISIEEISSSKTLE